MNGGGGAAFAGAIGTAAAPGLSTGGKVDRVASTEVGTLARLMPQCCSICPVEALLSPKAKISPCEACWSLRRRESTPPPPPAPPTQPKFTLNVATSAPPAVVAVGLVLPFTRKPEVPVKLAAVKPPK